MRAPATNIQQQPQHTLHHTTHCTIPLQLHHYTIPHTAPYHCTTHCTCLSKSPAVKCSRRQREACGFACLAKRIFGCLIARPFTAPTTRCYLPSLSKGTTHGCALWESDTSPPNRIESEPHTCSWWRALPMYTTLLVRITGSLSTIDRISSFAISSDFASESRPSSIACTHRSELHAASNT